MKKLRFLLLLAISSILLNACTIKVEDPVWDKPNVGKPLTGHLNNAWFDASRSEKKQLAWFSKCEQTKCDRFKTQVEEFLDNL